jgi:homoserine kinase
MEKIRVYAPATVANVACGFDIFGFAVNHPGDEVVLVKKSSPGIVIKEITGDEGRLPKAVEKNTAGIAIQKYLAFIGREDQGFELSLHKDMPLGLSLIHI